MGPEVLSDPLTDSILIREALYLRGVLSGDQNRVDRDRTVVFVDHTDLGLPIR